MAGGDLFDRYRRLGNLIAVTLSNASLYAKTLRAAEHDGLTGLLNRQTIDARYDSMLQLAEETGKPFAAALMDLDGLKAINDSFGHRAGDDAIRGFAHLLAISTPDDAFIGRFGGDEFLVLLPGTDMQAVQQWVKAVQAGVDAQNSQGDLPFPVEFSVGAGAWPETADPIAAADHQLYQHKRRRHSPAGSGPSELERAAGELLNGLRRLRGATWAGLLRLDSFQSPAWLAQSGETMAVIDPQLVSATLARGETVEQKLDEDWALLVVSCSHLGRLTGALAAVVPAVETPAALSTLTAFAEAAAVLVVSPNGRSGTAAQVARLSALYEIARSFAATLDYRQVLSLILEYASRLTGADYVLISTMVGHERPLMLVGAYDLPAGLAAKITERQLRIDEGVVGRAVREARAQVVSDLRFDPDAKPVVPGMRSEATMPIVTGSALIGVIDLLSAEPATFDAVDLAFLGTLAQLSGVAITQARLYAQARHEAGRTLEVVRSLQQLVEYRLQDVSRRIAEELGAGVGRTHPQIEDLIGQLDRLTRSHRQIAETSFDGLNLLEVAGRVVEIASEARWSNPMPVLQVTGAAVPLTDRQANVTSLVLHELLLALLPADGRKQASEIRIRITTTPATAVISVYCWLLPRLLESLPLLNEQVASELLGTVCYKRGRVIIEFPLRPVEPILWTPTPVLRNRT